MLRNTLLLLGVSFFSTFAFAQSSRSFIDTTSTFDHFVSLQANALIQQVFNFGESSELANPYVLKYALKHNKTGLTLNLAGGFTQENSMDENNIESQKEFIDYRVGLGWQKSLSKRFEFGVGVDIISGRSFEESNSTNIVVFGGNLDSTITGLRTKNNYFGYGAQLSLSYKISPNVLIGTETSIYTYSSEMVVNSSTDNYFIFTSPSDQPNMVLRSIQVDNETTESNNAEINLPIVLFLTVRF